MNLPEIEVYGTGQDIMNTSVQVLGFFLLRLPVSSQKCFFSN